MLQTLGEKQLVRITQKARQGGLSGQGCTL